LPQRLGLKQLLRRIDLNKTQVSKEKKLTLLLLCWLFGLFGVHRFYTGKYLTGCLQLFDLGLTVILALFEADIHHPIVLIIVVSVLLWWIVDVVLIIMGKFTDKEDRPIIDWM
jgi:TM2 domain-containing membrane protein YozV